MRIMAQKNGTPSAWTRQKEVITGQVATAVLVENAKKAKEAVAIIEKEIVEDESAGGTKSYLLNEVKADTISPPQILTLILHLLSRSPRVTTTKTSHKLIPVPRVTVSR